MNQLKISVFHKKRAWPCFCLFLFLLSSGSIVQAQDNVRVQGTILTEDGMPLPGANIIEKGVTNGVQSDFDGNFVINVSNRNAVLSISYIGFVAQEIPLNGQTTIEVVLREDTEQLDEVVVIGYGTITKKDLVSSVAQVKSDAFEKQPVVRLDQALQGRATGVSVTSNNGTPGAGSTIRIRGNSSINGNNAPLYVVDGFITGTDFNLNNLNVNDIESVEILKDATALSIYGTRGAAGVILVTTKNGKGISQAKPIITLNHYTSIQETANQIEILGGQGYVDYINESGQFVPGDDGFGAIDPDLPLQFDGSDIPDTDWLDIISQTGFVTNTDLSIAGSSENSNYYVALNHFDQKGVVRASGIERYTLRTNIDIRPSERFNFGLRFNGSHFKRENNKVSYSGIVTSVLPIRAVYDEDGNFTGTNPISSSTQRNPIADIELRVDHNLVTNMLANVYGEYELFKNFKLRTTFGAELTYTKENDFRPGLLPERVIAGNGGFASVETNFQQSLLNENTFNYDVNLGKHALKFLGGFTWQKNTSESAFSSATQIPLDALSFNELSLGDPLQNGVNSGYNQRTLTSFLGRVNYSFDSRYLLTLVGRYDGSSVFEEGEKYAFFPSVGVAWNIDQENFLRDSETINRLKIRGSYGIVGEQGVSTYNSLPIYNVVNTVFNNQLTNGVLPARIPSDGLKWETTKQLDIGLELGLFKNRLSLEVDYYNKKTEDLLLGTAIAAQAGGGTQLQNIGSVRNQGFEIALNTININTPNFRWESEIAISTNKSEVLELDGRDFIGIQSTGNQGGSSARLIVGERLPVFVGLNYLGTYKTAQEIIDDGREGLSFIGGPRFQNLDDNPVWNNEDVQILGTPEPDFFGGIRNTFTYKNLSIDLFFHGQYGNEIFNIRSQTAFFGRGDQNLDPIVLNRWREDVNETSDIPRAGASTSLFNPNSSVNIEDGSFLRLRQATLSYDVPMEDSIIKNTFNRLNLYLTGTNLWLLSDFRLGDPEVSNFTNNSGTNSVSQGFAGGVYPYARSFTLGVILEF